MENNKATMEEAVELFEQQRYREAIAAFAEVYDQSEDKNERETVFNILSEAFYDPNKAELRANYERNLQALKQYPYFFDKTFREYEELNFQLFPASDEFFYCYNKEKNCFEGEYDAATDGQMRYFFESSDKPLKAENEDNLYNLNFLNDNVRASEDYAGDNHIYLLYDTPGPLERLMMTCDLEPLLQQNKFVFLVGEENKKRYPVDFKKEFGIDYSALKPTPVRIEEIKRVCRWCAHLYSGTLLSLGVLGSLNEVQSIFGEDFHKGSEINGQPIPFTKEFQDALANFNTVYTAEQISEMIMSKKYRFNLPDSNAFLNWLRQQRPAPHEYTVKELFCGYFLFQYEKRNLNPRIAPMLIFDPHIGAYPYSELILSFPYHTALTSVREPITVFIRSQQDKVIGHEENSTKEWLASDYWFWQSIHPDLLPHYYAFRFEDLKTKPEIVCRALCKHLNLPYDKIMLEADVPFENQTHGVVRGFDTAPLKRDLSANLSEFDRMRLQMFYDPILRYYGYPTFPFEEHPLPENLVRELFKYPFRFEHVNSKIYGERAPSRHMLHAWIQDVLQNLNRMKFVPPKLIPLEEPAEPEQETVQNRRETSPYIGNRQERRKNRKKK